MKTCLTTEILPAGAAGTIEAARCLGRGGLVAFPTETVYGLGADASNASAIARLYEAKGRPLFNPLISHVADVNAARRIGRFDAVAHALAQAFWPGPLTLVLPRTKGCEVAQLATAGLETIAVRVPAHRVAQAILTAFGKPVVAPSANLSGHVSPTTAAHVQGDLEGRIDLIIDSGPVEVGVESTIIGCFETAMLLRPGGVPSDDIERVLGRPLAKSPADGKRDNGEPLAPGMLASHYAPRTRLRLNADSIAPGEALLAFGHAEVEGQGEAAAVMNLSEGGNLAEAASRLFGHVRKLDAINARAIAVMRIPSDGLGEAINDRLRRAAAARE